MTSLELGWSLTQNAMVVGSILREIYEYTYTFKLFSIAYFDETKRGVEF